MDATWARKLVDTVCSELALKKAKRALRPVGMAIALSTASMVAVSCVDEDDPDTQDQTEMPQDVYGIDLSDIQDVQEETELYPDLYGVSDVEETEMPADAYGIVDVEQTEMPADAYGIVDVDEETDDSELPVDAYGIADLVD